MNISEPYDLAMPRATARVLSVLMGANAAFSIRQVSRMAKVSFPQTLKIIDQESERGLVMVEQAGRSRMCRFNRDHLASKAVVELLTLRARMIHAIEEEILAWAIMPEHSSLFGSAARGDGGVDSDLDVLIVRPEKVPENQWEEQKYVSGMNLRMKIGNSVAWFDVSLAELRTAKDASEPIFSAWKKDGILLTGSSLTSLLGAAPGKSAG